MNANLRHGYRKAVSDLQSFLRAASNPDQSGASLIPDGIYGELTEKAVREFQQRHKIADTGKVDFETWQAIVTAYRDVSSEREKPAAVSPFSAHFLCGCVKLGDKSDTVEMIRLMVCTLKLEYGCFENIEVSDVFDPELEKAIAEFQAIHGIEQTGIIDKITWDHLAKEYNRYIKRNH